MQQKPVKHQLKLDTNFPISRCNNSFKMDLNLFLGCSFVSTEDRFLSRWIRSILMGFLIDKMLTIDYFWLEMDFKFFENCILDFFCESFDLSSGSSKIDQN